MAEKESRKRKRQANGVEASNKKAALQGANSDKIEITIRDEDGLPPVLLSSPGLTAPSISFRPYGKSLSSRHVTNTPPKPHTHSLLLHSSQHPRLDYTASATSLDQNLAHYVAIFDPSIKQLRISPAHHLSLRTKVRSESQGEDGKKRRTYAQQREALGREFGTKKAKKAIAGRIVNAISKHAGPSKDRKTNDVQSAILDSVADATAGGKADLTEQQQLEAALSSKPIPQPHLSAENIEEVYTFNTLIQPADARLINVKDWQEATRANEPIDFAHRFPAARVEAIGKSDDLLRLKALRYLSLLLEFHDALTQLSGRSGTGKKVPKKDKLVAKLADWPEALIDSVRRRFANAAGNELPKWHMDNLYTHICALSLYVDGWTTDVTLLRDDLRMENKEIGQYFRELGCQVGAPTEKESQGRKMGKKVAGVTRMARLRLPLDFPRPRVSRRR